MTIDRVILIILDSVGAGAAPDAADYGDEGSDTLANTARQVGGVRLPNLQRLGLGNLTEIQGVPPMAAPVGAFGRMVQSAAGKDSAGGHWELAGLQLDAPLASFPQGLPKVLANELTRITGRGVLPAVATAHEAELQALGPEHMATGSWIVTTSNSSVVHISAHEDVVPLDELYDACRAARTLFDAHRVGRVVASPFTGPRKDRFEHTRRRRDYALMPPRATVFDRCQSHGVPVVGIGRIEELFCGQGLDDSLPTQGNTDGMIKTVEILSRLDRGLVVTNLGDFDTRYGHARDPGGYARCLEEFDVQLAMLLSRARDNDLLLLTADHGNDPTRQGWDHSREYVPILAVGPAKAAGVDLGTRTSFADVGATICEVFGTLAPEAGEGFYGAIS
ncbi:MAG: phosphopentomutase [Acidobacteriota bacterium]